MFDICKLTFPDFRYRKNVHARVEKRGPNETIYHSLEVNGPINVELKRHNLETMDAVFKVINLAHLLLIKVLSP